MGPDGARPWSLANFQAVFGKLTGEDARPTLWRAKLTSALAPAFFALRTSLEFLVWQGRISDPGCHRRRDRLTNAQGNGRPTKRFNPNRKPLRQANPINRLIDGREQVCRRPRRPVLNIDTPSDTADDSFERELVISHDHKVRLLTDLYVGQLCFLEIGGDPE